MANSIYKINKGINKSMEFKGLKAQYIWYLGAGVISLLILFAILYISGLNRYLCLFFIAVAGTALVMKTYSMSRRYGEHGLMKSLASKSIPAAVRVRGRGVFIQLQNSSK